MGSIDARNFEFYERLFTAKGSVEARTLLLDYRENELTKKETKLQEDISKAWENFRNQTQKELEKYSDNVEAFKEGLGHVVKKGLKLFADMDIPTEPQKGIAGAEMQLTPTQKAVIISANQANMTDNSWSLIGRMVVTLGDGLMPNYYNVVNAAWLKAKGDKDKLAQIITLIQSLE